jgi:ABC-2 type transport system ATP-binding protein
MPPARATRRIDDIVDALALNEIISRPVRTYSGGQRRRLEIARAVLAEPRVLFLDEPTVGLDPAIRHDLWSLIGDLRAREGVTLVLTTHYLEEAERLCERLAIMHQGRVVALDAPATLLANLGEQILEIEGVNGDAMRELRTHGIPTQGAYQLGSQLTIPFRNGFGDRAVRALREASLPIRSISVRRPTLDDVYLRLTGATLKG